MTDEQYLQISLDDELNMGHLETVRQLLEQGANINGKNTMDDTPLMVATYAGQADAVRLLLEFGADTNARNYIRNANGITARKIAQELGHHEVLLVFAELSVIEWRDEKDMTIYDILIVGGVFTATSYFASLASSRSNLDQRRIADLESKMNLLLDHFGIEHNAMLNNTDALSDSVVSLVRQGRKISAIKLYRDEHPGVGLKEAKEKVDQVEQLRF